MHQRSIADVHLLFVRTEERQSARIERKLLEDLIDDVVRYWDNGIRITVDYVEFHSHCFRGIVCIGDRVDLREASKDRLSYGCRHDELLVVAAGIGGRSLIAFVMMRSEKEPLLFSIAEHFHGLVFTRGNAVLSIGVVMSSTCACHESEE